MLQVLHIDESNNLVGHLKNHHVEKLLSSPLDIEIGKAENNEIDHIIISSPLLACHVVISRKYGCWGRPWYRERLYLRSTNRGYDTTVVPDNVISRVQETIAWINAILGFDRTLVYQLRIFSVETERH